jgi:hypothetical protein
MFVALTAILGFLIEDGDAVNAYAHANAEGPTIFLVADDVFQSWYKDSLDIDLPLGTCVPIIKAMQGHPEAGNWWSNHFDASCAALRPFASSLLSPNLPCTAATMLSVPSRLLCSVKWTTFFVAPLRLQIVTPSLMELLQKFLSYDPRP